MLGRIAASPLGRWSEPLIGQPAMLATVLKWAAVLLRLYAGFTFVQYGFDKLFNNNQTYGMGPDLFIALNIPFPELTAFLVGLLEFFGGIALIVGLFTRIFGFLLAGSMVVAMITYGNPSAEGPLFIACALLVIIGGGMLSLDQLLDRQFSRGKAK